MAIQTESDLIKGQESPSLEPHLDDAIWGAKWILDELAAESYGEQVRTAPQQFSNAISRLRSGLELLDLIALRNGKQPRFEASIRSLGEALEGLK